VASDNNRLENINNIDQKPQEYYDALADKLDELNKVTNFGRGAQHIRYIISSLRNGNIDEAKTDRFN